MKVGDTRPGGPAAVTRSRAPAKPGSTNAASSVQAPPDTASVLGIPEAELTPKVREAIMTLMAEVDRLRQELDRSNRRLAHVERLADQDPLAPIANRRAFVRELTRIISFSERYQMPASLLYFDVNGFKQVNDTFGHGAGDAALTHVAQILLDNVRESDVVGRLGGDEFGVILASADTESATEKAEKLADVIRSTPFVWQGNKISLGVAVGACAFQPGIDAAQAIEEADKAMFANKRRLKGEQPQD
jgi:diguanylate cyclase (GGDEF)-like protein